MSLAQPWLLLGAGLFAVTGAALFAAAWDLRAAQAATTIPQGELHALGFVTAFGSSGYMFALSGGLAAMAWLRSYIGHDVLRTVMLRQVAERAAFVFACVAISGIAAQAIKHLLGRMRPRFLLEVGAFHWAGPTLRAGADSFPSGHTTSAFAAATALCLMSPRLRIPLLAAATLVGVSRVMTGNHYPSDVLAGGGLGAGLAWALAVLCARRGWVFSRTPSVQPSDPAHIASPARRDPNP